MAHLPSREEVQTPQSQDPVVIEKLPKTKSETDWARAIHRFHLTGDRTSSEEILPSDRPLVPALLLQLEREGRLGQQYPFYLPKWDASEGEEAQPLVGLLQESLDRCEQQGKELRILRDNLHVIANFLNHPANSGIQKFTPEVYDRIRKAFDLSSTGQKALEKELEIIQSQLNVEGRLIRLGPKTLLHLFSWVCHRYYAPWRRRLLQEVRRASNGLESLLLVDKQKSPDARTPESLAAVIGDQGNVFVDPALLSRTISGQGGSLALSGERRERITKARDLLSHFLSEAEGLPLFHLVHSEPLNASEDIPGAGMVCEPDSFTAALELQQELMTRMVEVFKALRVAHLEIPGDYEPELHDPMLDHFDWQSLEADEVRAVTPVVIWEPVEKIYQSGLTGLSCVLRSGLPLKILISAPNLTSEKELSGFLPDLGHILVAHRENVVVQSSLVDPSRLVERLRLMTASLRPAAAVITGPADQSDPEWSWPEFVTAYLSRSYPSFVYDPDGGSSWAERFTLESIPDQARVWLSVNWSVDPSDGAEQSREEALTFAHAAAFDPSYRRHFLTIPEEAWSKNQIEVGAYLDSYEDQPREAIPFIWILGPDRVPQRAIVTRELVGACRDRQRSWKIVQELAGINNEYVRRAVEETRLEVESAARAEIEAIGDRERSEGAAQAIDRLVALFTDPSALAAGQAATPSAPVEAPPKEPVEEEEPKSVAAAEEEEEEEAFSAEPYIDSFLCTSCNDCINLNPQLFRYNEDKQAVIGDVSAGTFLELVKAAEACPAHCIHPGSPAEDDETATPEVIARARAFQ